MFLNVHCRATAHSVFANFANLQKTFRESETPAEGGLRTLLANRTDGQCGALFLAVTRSITTLEYMFLLASLIMPSFAFVWLKS